MDNMDKLGLNFGLVIAYMIPGFSATYALASHVGTIDALLGGPGRVPSTASVVPLLLIAVAIGIVINAISWVVIRPVIHRCGVREESGLVNKKLSNEDRLRYDQIVEATFRYHQFYSNMLVAVVLLGPMWLLSPRQSIILRIASFLLTVMVLFLAARNALQQFYTGLSKLCDEGPPVQSS